MRHLAQARAAAPLRLARRTRRTWRRTAALLAAALAGLAGGLPLASGGGAQAAPVATLRSRAAAIARQIDALQVKLQILSEEYDQAGMRAGVLAGKIRLERLGLAGAERRVASDRTALRSAAITAYVTAGDGGMPLSGNPDALPLQQTYLSAASGTLQQTVTLLDDAEHHLTVRAATLHRAEQRAVQAADTINASRTAARRLAAQLQATEASVTGQLAAAVAAQEVAQQQAAAAAAASLARAAAAQPPVPTAAPATSAVAATSGGANGAGGAGGAPANAPAAPAAPSSPSVPSSGGGSAAVAAARSQLGVPYVWGGATPGAGFDCSGLAMWSWAQAGVSLPHSAQAQYDSIQHVSLSQLQPGDLVFYASGGYIYHVVMYIGGGEVIQAETTGTPVQITPLWSGAYGAGRP